MKKKRLSGVFRRSSSGQSISQRERTSTPTPSNPPVPSGRFAERMSLRQITEAAALDLRKEQRREQRREEGIRRLDELLADLSPIPEIRQCMPQGLMIDRPPTPNPTPEHQHHRLRLFEGSLSPIEEERSSKSSRSSHGDRTSISSTVRAGNSLALNTFSSTLM